MLKSLACTVAVLLVATMGAVNAQDASKAAKDGATAYRICAACHSLLPGVHLSGPSLAGLWARKPASNDSYGRYSEPLKALQKDGLVWDEDTLNAWLADPQAMARGTTMTFQGVENDQTRGNLIAFLRLATAEGGANKVVKEGLIPESMAEGQIPPEVAAVGSDQEIKGIRHCRDAFYITTADGSEMPVWETNVRIKIDTSVRGPGIGAPVLLRSGMAGDRMSVVFASLVQAQEFLIEKC